MSDFALGRRSVSKLSRLHPHLSACVVLGIKRTEVDFTVIEGERDPELQQFMFDTNKSHLAPPDGKHLVQTDGYVHAVDLGAWVESALSFEWDWYFMIARGMRDAAMELGVDLRWGGAWHKSLTGASVVPEVLHLEYIELRQSQGRISFLDGPHFELLT